MKPPRAKVVAMTALLLLVVTGIGWADYKTGPDLGFSLFYLVPVAFASWLLRRAGLAIAVAAAIAWLLADLAWAPGHMVGITQWNGFTRLVIYVSIAFLVALLREDRDRLATLNEQLSVALGAESVLARTDRLTDLANSRNFLEHLELDLRAARAPICVAIIDIDNFKRVNDVYGHHAGDALLRRVASDLADLVRGTDVAARMGGDEFAVLLRGVEPEGASKIATRILERVAAAALDYPGTGVGASIGIAWFASPPDRADEVLRAADAAMYDAKSAGKGTYRVTFAGEPITAGAGTS